MVMGMTLRSYREFDDADTLLVNSSNVTWGSRV